MIHYEIPTGPEIAAKARALILEDLRHYDSEPALAKKAGTNPYTLKKEFAAAYGVTVFQFSRQVRMERACELLGTTNYTIQTIAEMIGFAEGNNFQAAFKTVMGISPGKWRKANAKMG